MTPAPDELAPSPPGVEVCACDESIALRRELARLNTALVEAEARARPVALSARARNGWSSRFKGVSWHAKSARWRARVLVEGRRVSLGAYLTEDEAASAVDCALRAKEAATQAELIRLTEALAAAEPEHLRAKEAMYLSACARADRYEAEFAAAIALLRDAADSAVWYEHVDAFLANAAPARERLRADGFEPTSIERRKMLQPAAPQDVK